MGGQLISFVGSFLNMIFAAESGINDAANNANKVAEWLSYCEKTLDFVYSNKPNSLTVLEALQGDPRIKICDPYGYISEEPLSKKVERIENENGKPVDKANNLSGNFTVKLTTGEEISGRWIDGKREGSGSLQGPRLEKMGVTIVVGEYQDGSLIGQGKVLMRDGSVLEGWFQHGYFHGATRGKSKTGTLNYIGQYRAGIPSGMVWRSVRGGGWIVGCVDHQGRHSGPEIAFLYPDLTTALFGEFRDGILTKAQEAILSDIEIKDGILCPCLQVISERYFCHWPSTKDDIQCPPLQEDPYEFSLLTVRQSDVEGGGEGVFAKRDIPVGTVVAYYNGIRMMPGESCPYEDTGYAIYTEWNSVNGCKSGGHMDLPPKYHSSAAYKATLAHKLNHSFTPNCTWTNADHPCFEYVPSVTTVKQVRAGEELTIHYKMYMEDAPEWYKDSWDVHSIKISE